MLADAIYAYLHFAAIFTLIWFVAKEWTLLKAGVDTLDIVRLAKSDIGYFLAAIAVLATGLTRALAGAKGWAFYAHNSIFHTKVGLFLLVALISIWPTRAFIRWRKAAATDPLFRPEPAEWRLAKRLVMVELHLIALIPLAAVLMARGFGFHG